MSAAYETLLVERSDEGFATIVFIRPDKLNTLTIRLRQELAIAKRSRPTVRVLILGRAEIEARLATLRRIGR